MALFCFQNTVYPSYRKEASNNAHPTQQFSVGVFFSVLQALKRRGRKRKILSSKNFTLGMPKASVEMPRFSTMAWIHATVKEATS